MQVKMKHMGHRHELHKPSPAPEKSSVMSYPELSLSDRHMEGMEHLQRGHKVALMFNGEVTGTENVDNEYRKGLDVRFRLTHGHIEQVKKKGTCKFDARCGGACHPCVEGEDY